MFKITTFGMIKHMDSRQGICKINETVHKNMNNKLNIY